MLYQQSGAVEACWAHNPEVRGSKPRSANFFTEIQSHVFFFIIILFFNLFICCSFFQEKNVLKLVVIKIPHKQNVRLCTGTVERIYFITKPFFFATVYM